MLRPFSMSLDVLYMALALYFYGINGTRLVMLQISQLLPFVPKAFPGGSGVEKTGVGWGLCDDPRIHWKVTLHLIKNFWKTTMRWSRGRHPIKELALDITQASIRHWFINNWWIGWSSLYTGWNATGAEEFQFVHCWEIVPWGRRMHRRFHPRGGDRRAFGKILIVILYALKNCSRRTKTRLRNKCSYFHGCRPWLVIVHFRRRHVRDWLTS